MRRVEINETERLARNVTLVRALLLPTTYLTVAMLGGLRIAGDSRTVLFLPPPLIALLLASLLLLLFIRGRLLELRNWFSYDFSLATNLSHALTLLALFFASAQAFNAVLPERGFFHWLLSFFLLWTLWNNLFAPFDARRLLRSLAVLFGTAFLLKYLLLASLGSPEGGWLQRIANALLEGATLGTVEAERFAPATGYIAFFAVALYIVGLVLMALQPRTAVCERAATSPLPEHDDSAAGLLSQ